MLVSFSGAGATESGKNESCLNSFATTRFVFFNCQSSTTKAPGFQNFSLLLLVFLELFSFNVLFFLC